MNSREQILARIRQIQQPELLLPSVAYPTPVKEELATLFGENLQKIGGTIVSLDSLEALHGQVEQRFPSATKLIWAVDSPQLSIADARQLEQVEVAVVRAQLGVAENGAVWLPDALLPHRVLPFICQHLCVLLDANNLVANMHEAYQNPQLKVGAYGVFIAGPSKTADIEQSLVIGAHGARSMTVFILEPNP